MPAAAHPRSWCGTRTPVESGWQFGYIHGLWIIVSAGEGLEGRAQVGQSMHFAMLDRIETLEGGQSLRAVKTLSLGEEYLRDHFPLFPVMPGVLLLESMSQAAAWLLRVRQQFARSVVLLKEARAVKYAGFVRPGQTLQIDVQWQKEDEGGDWFKAKGLVEGQSVVSGRLLLESFNLAPSRLGADATDRQIRLQMEQELKILYNPSSDGATFAS